MRPATPALSALAGLCALAASCGGESRAVHARQGRYNVVIVSIDTLRADHLPLYGYARDTSPNLRQLVAREGIVFESAFSHSPKTGPSHMSLLTGLLPDAHGVENVAGGEENRALSPGIETLASILQKNGYRTAAFTEKGHVVAELGFDRGFDVFVSGGGAKGIFENGIQAVEEFAGDPFFLFVHTYEVHDPYTPPKGFREIWADPDYSGNVISDSAELTAAAGGEWVRRHEVFWGRVDRESPADVQHLRDLYDGSIRFVDKLIGSLIEQLQEQGELERTLLIVLSDHGEEFLEHGGFLHDTSYQELLHVPLVMRLPADLAEGRRGRRVESVVRLVDVVPTVLDALEIEVEREPARVGSSMLELLGSGTRSAPVVSAWPRQGQFAYRKDDWKIIWTEPGPGRAESLELYDLAADPNERHDLAPLEGERAAELLAGLKGALAACRAYLHSVQAGQAFEPDPEMVADLGALGYAGKGADEAGDEAGDTSEDEDEAGDGSTPPGR